MVEIRLLLFIFLIGSAFSAITIFIAKLSRNKCFIKYIPSIILFITGAAFLLKAKWFSEGMQDLGNILYMMLAVGGGIISLMTAILIDFIRKSKNTNQC